MNTASKKSEIAENENNIMSIMSGVDKTSFAIMAAVGISVAMSFYLFNEIKKMKEEIKSIKINEISEEIQEKVDMNSNAINAVTIKLEQLINALQQSEQRNNLQQQPEQKNNVQEHQETKKQRQVQIPILGGSMFPPGDPDAAKTPIINLEDDDEEEEFTKPGVIRI